MYANRIFLYITHTDPKTSNKVFAHLDTTPHFSFELHFLSVLWTRVPFSYVSQMLWGKKSLAGYVWRKVSHQRTCLLYPIAPMCVLPYNLAKPRTSSHKCCQISLDRQEHNTATNTVCCSKGTLPYRQDPQFPPALHFKYHSKLPHVEGSRLSHHRAVDVKTAPDILHLISWV